MSLCKSHSSSLWHHRILPIVTTFFSLTYSLLIPTLITSTWESNDGIFRAVKSNVHQNYTTIHTSSNSYKNQLLNLGVSGIGYGIQLYTEFAMIVYQEILITSWIQMIARMLPLLLLLRTLHKIET